ncbi:MAG: hypothetical protein PUC37_06810 [Spirochaetales bacterium]|nr:hypothetical protein [Spirochaetales bacterium]
MKKINFVILLVFILSMNVFGFDKQNQVISGLQSGKYEDVKILLQEWEKENPKDPDLMTGWFNYYINRKAEEKSMFGYMKNGQYGMYSKIVYDENDLKTAISYLDKALKTNPYRMDIYFGKINSLLSAEKYSDGSKAIIDFLKAYEKNKTDWYWSYNQKFSDNNWNVENIVLGTLQDYCQLFDFYVDRDSVKSALDQILKVFPKNVVFLNYLSYYYSSAKEYEKSIEVLLSAYKIDPDDYIIIGNLASDYEKMENYKEAEKWYTIMSKINSDNAKAYASEGLERVRNKK